METLLLPGAKALWMRTLKGRERCAPVCRRCQQPVAVSRCARRREGRIGSIGWRNTEATRWQTREKILLTTINHLRCSLGRRIQLTMSKNHCVMKLNSDHFRAKRPLPLHQRGTAARAFTLIELLVVI